MCRQRHLMCDIARLVYFWGSFVGRPGVVSSNQLLSLAIIFSLSFTGCSRESTKGTTSVSRGLAATSGTTSQPTEGAGSATTFASLSSYDSSFSQRQKAEHSKLLDPQEDGWDTEALASDAQTRLKKIGKIIAGENGSTGESVASQVAHFLHSDFRCGRLCPAEYRTVYQDQGITVRHGVAVDDTVSEAEHDVFQGSEGFGTALEELQGDLQEASDIRVDFKVFRIEAEGEEIRTEAIYDASRMTPQGSEQQNSIWHCRWKPSDDGESLLLYGLQVRQYEAATYVAGARRKMFSDCTESVFGDAECFHRQLSYDFEYWLSRVEGTLGGGRLGRHGLAVGDVNGDHLDDLYLCQPAAQPNLLLIQNPDGTLRDISRLAGVDILDRTTSGLIIDLDNDGNQDLASATDAGILIMSNDGQGRFTRRTTLLSGDCTSLVAIDFDRDGDLDLFGCMYARSKKYHYENRTLPLPVPYHDANNGSRNILYRNDGSWNFTDVTTEVGLDQNNSKFSFAAVWEDFDNDGDDDLYVANDFGRNNFYRNDNGQFSDVAAQVGVEDMSTGMAVTVADYDRDGWMDLYISNMWSSAGNRVTYQERFRSDDRRGVSQYQYLSRGNTLFRAAGDGTFRDASTFANVTRARWAWATLFVDVNNDGWEDLLVANGHVTGKRQTDL